MIEYRDRIDIREAYEKADLTPQDGRAVSPYSLGIDWIEKFSPIEDYVWGSIRYLGIPLYPQYPVGPFFLDFADPFKKIGIEVDSVKWHQDKDADRSRQQKIEAMGWKVYRIPSSMVYAIREDFQDDDGKLDVERYVEESAEGMLWDIFKRERE